MEQASLFCFGYGYTASYIAKELRKNGFKIHATTRNHEKIGELRQDGIIAHLLPCDVNEIIPENAHILISAAPNENGDPILAQFYSSFLKAKARIKWIGYLSATSVYGDSGGNLVNENTSPNPTIERGKRRLLAEQQWLELEKMGFPVHIFRLGGIYGPNRSAFDKIKNQTAIIISDKSQIVSRIHVEDIARIINASINKANSGSIYNLVDDKPSSSNEVIKFANELIGGLNLKTLNFEDANLSDAAKSFFIDDKRVCNNKFKQELEYELQYPSYIEGLRAIYDFENKN